MKCTKCNSENVQVQVIVKKNTIMAGFVFLFLGIGLMIFGILGGIVGLIVGMIVGAIVKCLMGDIKETVAVCQDCGKSFTPKVTAKLNSNKN